MHLPSCVYISSSKIICFAVTVLKVHAVLREDDRKDEPIVTVDNRILTRKDLQTLKRNHSVECRVCIRK